VSFGGWATTTQLAGAIIAHGNLVVDGNSKNVQHLNGGIIAELSVKEGEFVRAGEIVIRLSDTDTKADLATIANSLVHL
ncbi:MAG: biotin/lipoyl-binding protein, partial [Cohaesibacter sp.]|nr:biotin/lipoyl-binding protein [Cohaesibacter sp.]